MSIRKTKFPELKQNYYEGFKTYFSHVNLVTRQTRNNGAKSSTVNLNDVSSADERSRQDSSEDKANNEANIDDTCFFSIRNSSGGGSPRLESWGKESTTTCRL